MKKIILLTLTIIFAFASQIVKPLKVIHFSSYIDKLAFNQKFIIGGLENSTVEIKDAKTYETIYTIKLPKIHDFMGDLQPMPVYSLDISPDGKTLLILTEDEEAKRDLFLFDLETHKLTKVFTTKETLMKARFINNHQIFFGLLSDEVTLYDLNQKKFLYKVQADSYVFSTFALNRVKTKAAIGDESGSIKIIEVKNGKILAKIMGFNKDKTLSLDFVKNYVINGSSDKRVAVYDITTKYSKIEMIANFLPYAVALSPKLDTFALQYDENNDIRVYDFDKKLLYILRGHSMPLNGIYYINENKIISFSTGEVIIWNLKE
jgi:WD40 repeat protein